MKYFCKACSTEAVQKELCSGCGSMMTLITDEHHFMLEVIDQVLSRQAGEPVVYERRGPFKMVCDAEQWWEQHQAHRRYADCTADVVLLEPPIHFTDKSVN